MIRSATIALFALATLLANSAQAQTRLERVTSAPESQVGTSVALSGDRAIVGAPGDGEKGAGAGAAYVYVFNGSAWTLEAKLRASNGAAGHDFGTSVAMEGDRIIVGAPGELFDSGSAYIFEFNGSSWSETAQIYDQGGAPRLRFGHSVALEGDRVLVGLPGDSEFNVYRGSAYVFDYNGSQWTETKQFRNNDGGKGNPLGTSVALSGNRALVGASTVLPDGSFGGPFAAYMFEFDGTSWDDGVKLEASDPNNATAFGTSVALDGDRALIGAFANNPDAVVSVFTFDGTTWQQSATLSLAPDTYTFGFGISVALDGDRALIGHYNDDAGDGRNPGAAYVFEFDGATWTQTDRIADAEGIDGHRFGSAVALDGDRALVGAPRYQGSDGTAIVFDLDGSTWTQQPRFAPAEGVEFLNDRFGSPIAFDGNRVAVSAPNDGEGLGAIYVFESDGTTWTQQAEFVSPDAERGFGEAISLDGDRILVGAVTDNGHVGAAYVFRFDGSAWVQEADLELPEDARWFGAAVAIHGDWALVGDVENGDTGFVHAYKFDGTSWTLQASLVPSEDRGRGFGSSISLDGNRALIGYPEDRSVYVFDFNGSGWEETARLESSAADAQDRFGRSVALDGDHAIVSAPGDNAVYIYSFDGTSWVEEMAEAHGFEDPDYWDFGTSVAFSGTRAVVGTEKTVVAFEYDGTAWNEQVVLKSPAGDLVGRFGSAVALHDDVVVIGDPREKLGPEDLNGSGAAYVYDLSDPTVANESLIELPSALALDLYPNPATDAATLSLTLSTPGNVRVDVYDLLGRRVAAVHDGMVAAGNHVLQLPVALLPSGHYFVRATTGETAAMQRFTVTR